MQSYYTADMMAESIFEHYSPVGVTSRTVYSYLKSLKIKGTKAKFGKRKIITYTQKERDSVASAISVTRERQAERARERNKKKVEVAPPLNPQRYEPTPQRGPFEASVTATMTANFAAMAARFNQITQRLDRIEALMEEIATQTKPKMHANGTSTAPHGE